MYLYKYFVNIIFNVKLCNCDKSFLSTLIKNPDSECWSVPCTCCKIFNLGVVGVKRCKYTHFGHEDGVLVLWWGCLDTSMAFLGQKLL